MNPHDFLTLAEWLAQADTEAAWRTSVSRAYYSVFHVACDFFSALGFDVPNADRAHGYLWLRLCNCGVAELVRAGQILKDLRGRRNIADYELSRRVTQTHAEKALADALSVSNILDEARDETNFDAILEGIKTYERDVLKEVTWQG